MNTCQIDYSNTGMTLVGVTSLFAILLLHSCVTSHRSNRNFSFSTPKYLPPTTSLPSTPSMCYITEINCFFNHFKYPSTTNLHLDAFNKRQIGLTRRNYVTPAFTSRAYDVGIRPPYILYGKLNQHLPKLDTRIDHNVSKNINSIKANEPVFYGAIGREPFNVAANSNNYLLQSIKNPVYNKPITNFIEPVRNISNTPGTRRTNSPTAETIPYSSVNTTLTTRKSLIDRPNSNYEQWNSNMYSNFDVMARFIRSLDSMERKFYKVTFDKLTATSPTNRKENGISFAQTGIFLQLALMALSSEVDMETRREIEECIGLKLTDREKIYVLREMVSSLPKTSEALKFRLSSRLVLGRHRRLSPQFRHGVAPAMRMYLDRVNITDTAQALANTLNNMIEKDSKGAMRDTFEEEELSNGICAVLLSTMYVRARWRSAPTVLNGTHAFLDSAAAPPRTMRMIRINDIMRYTELNEWDAEAIEIFYATPGLSLLLLVPRGRSLRKLAGQVAETSIYHVLERMYSLRVAVTLPLYTLRMTLLLPNKLQAMGISQLVDEGKADCKGLRLSHAVQRLMFWAEAGRNAFKDDGIEWDEAPELELVVNRPYVFFVRWRNITIMNGHFVL